jgi:hypothetical protein
MSKEHRLKIAEVLKSAPLNDIPAKLRELADQCEQGLLDVDAMVIAYSQADGGFMTMGLAQAVDTYRAYYLFCCAQRCMEYNGK